MRKASDVDNLTISHPEIAALWHPSKNGTRKPDSFLSRSNEVVWWRCVKGHEWQSRVEHLTRGLGCPYCSGHRPSQESNLQTDFPGIALRWHPTRNGELKPSQIRPGSDKVVWWVCPECGHEWRARVANQTKQRGSGCPVCQRKSIAAGNRERGLMRSGSLGERFPSIAEEWHPTRNGGLSPHMVSAHSGDQVWWRCYRGHEWQVSVNQRTRGFGTWCPKCNPQVSKLEVAVFCELLSIFEDAEWQARLDGVECDILVKSLRLAVEVDGFPWHRDHAERDQVKNRFLEERGLSVIRLRDRRLGRISQQDILYDGHSPHLAVIIRLLKGLIGHGLVPKHIEEMLVAYISDNRLQNDDQFRAIVAQLPQPPYESSIAHLHPALVRQWNALRNDPMGPSLFTAGSGQVVWWKCPQGHEWKASISDRVKGRGCPTCGQTSKAAKYRRNAVAKKGPLAVSHPQLASDWHKTMNGTLTPYDRSGGSSDKVWWQCEEGHEWQAIIKSRAKGNGCPYCSHYLAAPETCLASVNPELSSEWNSVRNGGLTPCDLLPNSNRRVWWQCEIGHEWQARVCDRNRGGGCPTCRGRGRL